SAACLGTCGLAPVVMINDRVYSRVTPDQVAVLLERSLHATESLLMRAKSAYRLAAAELGERQHELNHHDLNRHGGPR
ncbi:MAG: NAD(P)H-dependent oxidoreductase subunit E, partial [Actinomycetota bacterium]|nr:NAD(P)H-dependent oxidoreductase subunit E [Actinomycetota bacterium]